MFEQELADKFKRIFDFKKVTYDDPGESNEQEGLFINVESPHFVIKDGVAKARIEGQAYVFANTMKLPFGYFSKAIAKANPADTRKLFFFEIEDNTPRYRNIVQRGFSFVYFFSGQYDPDLGNIESVTFTNEEL